MKTLAGRIVRKRYGMLLAQVKQLHSEDDEVNKRAEKILAVMEAAALRVESGIRVQPTQLNPHDAHLSERIRTFLNQWASGNPARIHRICELIRRTKHADSHQH